MKKTSISDIEKDTFINYIFFLIPKENYVGLTV